MCYIVSQHRKILPIAQTIIAHLCGTHATCLALSSALYNRFLYSRQKAYWEGIIIIMSILQIRKLRFSETSESHLNFYTLEKTKRNQQLLIVVSQWRQSVDDSKTLFIHSFFSPFTLWNKTLGFKNKTINITRNLIGMTIENNVNYNTEKLLPVLWILI